jgi:hypothetical protein
MPNNILQNALRQMRGDPPLGDPYSAAMSSAPAASPMPGLNQAYDQPMNPAVTPGGVPMQFSPGMEQQAQAQGQEMPVHPIIQQLMQHLGLLGMIRNRSNQNVLDPMAQG